MTTYQEQRALADQQAWLQAREADRQWERANRKDPALLETIRRLQAKVDHKSRNMIYGKPPKRRITEPLEKEKLRQRLQGHNPNPYQSIQDRTLPQRENAETLPSELLGTYKDYFVNLIANQISPEQRVKEQFLRKVSPALKLSEERLGLLEDEGKNIELSHKAGANSLIDFLSDAKNKREDIKRESLLKKGRLSSFDEKARGKLGIKEFENQRAYNLMLNNKAKQLLDRLQTSSPGDDWTTTQYLNNRGEQLLGLDNSMPAAFHPNSVSFSKADLTPFITKYNAMHDKVMESGRSGFKNRLQALQDNSFSAQNIHPFIDSALGFETKSFQDTLNRQRALIAKKHLGLGTYGQTAQKAEEERMRRQLLEGFFSKGLGVVESAYDKAQKQYAANKERELSHLALDAKSKQNRFLRQADYEAKMRKYLERQKASVYKKAKKEQGEIAKQNVFNIERI
jgi:hypothetical protein